MRVQLLRCLLLAGICPVAGCDGPVTAADTSPLVDGSPVDGSVFDAEVVADASPDASSGLLLPAEPPATATFIWPVDGWLLTDPNDPRPHPVEVAAPFGTPVVAAREGVVVAAPPDSSPDNGFTLLIDHGAGYRTRYSHLARPASVTTGDFVATGEVVGAVGQTGTTNSSGPHLQFAIELDDLEPAPIPGLGRGEWVQRGDAVAGRYALEAIRPDRRAFEVIATQGGAPVFASPDQESEIVEVTVTGSIYTVSGSSVGYYFVRVAGGRWGWVVHTVTTPEGADPAGHRITANPANVRGGPSSATRLVGTADNGQLITVFETQGDYHRFLFREPSGSDVYAWTYAGNTEPTAQFEATVRADGVNVRSSPAVSDDPILGIFGFGQTFRVLEVRDGWYRLAFGGGSAWLAGWRTQGRNGVQADPG